LMKIAEGSCQDSQDDAYYFFVNCIFDKMWKNFSATWIIMDSFIGR
jgi:hypothetical protein